MAFAAFFVASGYSAEMSTELGKFAALFVCVWSVKCFHYLAAERSYSATTLSEHWRMCFGILLLHLVDGLLIYKYFYDVIVQNYLQHNVLITVFGFEIITQYPMTLSTSVHVLANLYEDKVIRSCEAADQKEWKRKKLSITFTAEFVLYLARFATCCIYSVIFMYYYTYPVYVAPASYTSLKGAVTKTRLFIDFRKKELAVLRLRHFSGPADMSQICIICYDDIKREESRLIPSCSHTFHHECLRRWLDYLACCPICRSKL